MFILFILDEKKKNKIKKLKNNYKRDEIHKNYKYHEICY
jgi:hypothetical protein